MDVDGLTLRGALLVLNSRRSRFRFVTIPMDGVGVHKLSNVRSSGLDFAKILSRKLYSSISTWGRRRTIKNKETE